MLSQPDGGYQLDNILMLDSLMTAFVFVVLLLSLVRDQRAYLANEVVRRRQEAMDQAGLLGTVFESINEALVLMDTLGVVQLHNAAAVADPRAATSSPPSPSRWLRRLAESPSFTYGYNRDGSEDGLRILAVQLARVTYAGSDGVVAIVRDVTTEQRRIEELASFAAVAAHDLKSPLAAVQGWLEVAEDVMDSDPTMAVGGARARPPRHRPDVAGDRGLAHLQRRPRGRAPARARRRCSRCSTRLVKNYPDVDFVVRTPDSVMADRTLLQHLLVNLVGNAVKYTLPGERPSVTIRSFSGGDRGWVRLYVVDAGIGIPEGEETAIFEPFRRASTVKDTYEGSGLGLALCKRIVRRHGGLITAQRNEGPGTTITVTLPRG